EGGLLDHSARTRPSPENLQQPDGRAEQEPMDGPDRDAEIGRPIGGDVEECTVSGAEQRAGNHEATEQPEALPGSDPHPVPPARTAFAPGPLLLFLAASWDRLLAALAPVPELAGHVRLHLAVWQQVGEQVRAVDQLLADLARPLREDMHRLQAVPGVGPVVALTALAVFADVHRFASAKHVASYAGLVPSTYQSGTCDRHGHITKRGSAELRAMLCEAAHHARRPAPPLSPYFMKLCARRGYKIAIVAVAHRLCRLLYALLRDGTDFQPTRLGVEEGPFTQTITRRFRLTPKPAGRL